MTLLCRSSPGFVQFLDKVVDMPVVVQFFEMVVDVPVVQIVDVGVQFLDTVIDMPVIVHVLVRRAESCGSSAVAVP